MTESSSRNAYVIGSGPNGLTAAIVLARAGLSTTVFEAQPSIGGGARSAELTLPGFVHDICSAVHPLALSSPVFASFPLAKHGLEWIQPAAPLAHPLDDGSCVLLDVSVEKTAERLGRDGAIYRRTLAPLTPRWNQLVAEILAPLHWPAHPFLFARFGLLAAWPASLVARSLFRMPAARALFAGIAAHSIMPLERPGSAAFGWVLALAAHAVGWPIPRGGSQRIANALASYFESLGGRIVTNTTIRSLDELREAARRPTVVLCDVTPRQLLAIARSRLPERFCRKLQGYRYGPGAYKLDWALSGAIPWKASECARAVTVHIGGTLEEIAAGERAAWEGTAPNRPFVLLAQPSLFDSTRAPQGKHTAWAYCHVPNGSTVDMSERIEAQIERFAPGFRSTILARSVMKPADLERHNANLIGGDISGGAQDLNQLFLRPTRDLYRTPVEGLYLCSSSTPPGGAVHGMCGYHAARMALKDAGIPYADQFRK
jgi:phytoene dehydrogenase-like protein